MLSVARRRSSHTPCPVRFSVGDARSLGEADGTFDVVRSERLLQWVPGPEMVVAELVRVLRPGGRLSLIDTDWSTLRLDVDDPRIARAVRERLRVERRRPSNVGRRLGELAEEAGLEVLASATETQVWTMWDPDVWPAPEGCFSMASLAEDLVEKGQLEPSGRREFVDTIHDAARGGRFEMSLTMYAVVAASDELTGRQLRDLEEVAVGITEERPDLTASIERGGQELGPS